MKGISPLIASVLLIAFTVAVAGVISVFFTNLTTSSTASVNASTQVQMACAGSTITLTNITPTLFKVTYDVGTATLTQVNVTFVDYNGSTSTLVCSSSLTAGGVCSAMLNQTTILSPVVARARALCQGSAPVIDTWP